MRRRIGEAGIERQSASGVSLRLGAAAVAGLLFAGGCAGPETVDLVGTVERESLELAAPVSEVIVELPVEIGERVAAGEVVVRLDSEVAEAELTAAQAGVAAAQATLKAAEGEFARYDKLRRAQVGTSQQLDAARRDRDEARALVAEREARVAQAQKRLEDLTVRAWDSGILDQRPFEVGERVPAGGVVAVVLADRPPWVRVWLPARDVARVETGAGVEVRVEGLDQPIAGRVVDVAREASFTPHYALTEKESAHLVYETRVELKDAPAGLRPGLPARVRIVLAEEAT
jgi:HlyD family secretion protein